jgi:hypothetical protein
VSEPPKNSLLLAFGDLISSAGMVLPAAKIATVLLGSNRWFTTWMPARAPEPGTPILFYQAKTGVVATAKVSSTATATASEIIAALGYHEPMLRYSWQLQGVKRFSPPIHFRGFVNQLSFITNKAYWGNALRMTPRWIPDSDFATIVEAGWGRV